MPLNIRPINPFRDDFVAEVSGVDIAAGVSPETAAEIEKAMDQYGVLIFHDQVLDDEQQIEFSKHFGPLEKATGDIEQKERRLSMDVNDISNLDAKGAVLPRDARNRLFAIGNMLWHTDSSFKPTPAKYSLLSARVVPAEGGDTQFADMRAAWDALDEETKQECTGLVCEHSQIYSRGLLGFDEWTEEELEKNRPVRQRLVRRHMGSGRLSLYVASHAGKIEGWPVPEARMFLRDLLEFATQPAFTYTHRWKPNDLVIWDNRAVLHRARRYDHTKARDLHRTTVADCAPTLEQPF